MLLAFVLFSLVWCQADLNDPHAWVETTSSQARSFNFTLSVVWESFEVELVRTSLLNKTKPSATTYSVSIIRLSNGLALEFNSSVGFLRVPAPFNKSEDLVGQFESFLITIAQPPPHENFHYSIRACQGGCNNAGITGCLLGTEEGPKLSCHGNGACDTAKGTCECDNINWKVQLDDLPSSLRWIAEFLGKADSLVNAILWKDACEARADATRVLENLKLSLVIFITIVLASIVLFFGCIIGICCCCCRKSGRCGKKAENGYTPLNAEDYDLDADIDNYDEESE